MARGPRPPTLFQQVAAAARVGDVAVLDQLTVSAPDRIGAYLPEALNLAVLTGHLPLAEVLLRRGVPAAEAMANAASEGRADDVAWLESRGVPRPLEAPPPAPVPTTRVERDLPPGAMDLDGDLPHLRAFLASELGRWIGEPLVGISVFCSAESGQITVGLSVDPTFDPVARDPVLAQAATLSLPHWSVHHRTCADDAIPRAAVFRWLASVLPPLLDGLGSVPARRPGFRLVLQDDEEASGWGPPTKASVALRIDPRG